MPVQEIAIWSAMLGGLLTLAVLALADAVISPGRGALRNVAFVLVTGLTCVVSTGLISAVWPGLLPAWLAQMLQGGLGPMAGAVALYYLAVWLGNHRPDRVVHRIATWGGLSLGLLGLVLGFLSARAQPDEFLALLRVTAVANLFAALLGLGAAVRAVLHGDPLARWMLTACVVLVLLVSGHYIKSLGVPGFGMGTWTLTASLTVLYFLACIVLVVLRNRGQRLLAQLTRLQAGADPATGLLTGAMLVTEVEHAFWRTARFQDACTVICLHVRNLYELTQSAGPGTERQILAALTERIRQTVGFRCVLGLYHPRCFVVVISTDWQREPADQTVYRLRKLAIRPLVVTGRGQKPHTFVPQVGLGTVSLPLPGLAVAQEVIDEAERRALLADTRHPPSSKLQMTLQGMLDEQISTGPAPL